MKLARKMIFVVLTALIGAFGVLGYLDTRRVVGEYHERVAGDLRLTGRTVAPMLAEVSAVEGQARAHQLLDKIDRDNKSADLRWLSAGDLPLDEGQRRDLAGGGEVVRKTDRLSVYVPVGSTGTVLEVARSVKPTGAFERAIIARRMLLVALAALAAALISSIAAVKMIGTPMRRLTHQARLMGSGDLSRRLQMVRCDELGELAAALDKTCDDLQIAQRRAQIEADAKVNAERQVRHADKMSTVGTLAAGMAHELGTPLNIIGGRAKMIAGVAGAPSEAVRYAEIIAAQADRMRAILRGLLDFARRTPTKRQRTDVSRLAARVVELLQPLATKREVALSYSAMPDAGTPDVDAGQIEQAIVNVVVNGIQAMDHGGAVIADVHKVRTCPPHAKEDQDYVCVSVRDEGKGIRDEDMGHIFEPFFTTKPVGEGTGLGLAVTYGIVHDHGGFIDVQTKPGRGTTVSLYLPA
ncbi:MAG TPA: HAMP domain-containing sensor histidine kinase [Polyangiaceae bacterium]|jgi:signal transduction histidine kinase